MTATWNRQRTRRMALRSAAGVGALGITAAACGESRTPSAGQSAAPVSLTYAFYASAPEFEIWKRLCDEISQKSGRITVNPYQTNPDGDHFQRMRTLIAAGSESEVMMWKTLELSGDAIKDTFLPLDAFVK